MATGRGLVVANWWSWPWSRRRWGTMPGVALRVEVFDGLAVHDDARPVDLADPSNDRCWRPSPSIPAGPCRHPGSSSGSGATTRRPGPRRRCRRTSPTSAACSAHRKPREPAKVLVTVPAGYALAVGTDQVDHTAFVERAAAGTSSSATIRPSPLPHSTVRSSRGAAAAPRAGRGAVGAQPRVRLREIHAQALEDRFEAGLALGEHQVLVPRIEAAIREEPFRERLRGQLALALYRSWASARGAQLAPAGEDAPVEEIGIEPGPTSAASRPRSSSSPRRRRTDRPWIGVAGARQPCGGAPPHPTWRSPPPRHRRPPRRDPPRPTEFRRAL